jgi:hypothetical protein
LGATLLALQLAISVGFLGVVGVLAQALFGFSYQKYAIQGENTLIAQVYLGAPDPALLSVPGADRRRVRDEHLRRSLERLERVRAALRDEPGVRAATFASHFPATTPRPPRSRSRVMQAGC